MQKKPAYMIIIFLSILFTPLMVSAFNNDNGHSRQLPSVRNVQSQHQSVHTVQHQPVQNTQPRSSGNTYRRRNYYNQSGAAVTTTTTGYVYPVVWGYNVNTYTPSASVDETAQPEDEETDSGGYWVPASNGDVPANAIVNSYNNGSAVYTCRVAGANSSGYDYGVLVPGQGCNISDNSSTLIYDSYDTLVSNPDAY